MDARRHALEATAPILTNNRRLHLGRVDRALLANGQRLDVSEYGSLARSFLNSLEHAELKGICFENGLTETELGAFIEAFSQAKPQTIDHGFWSRFCEEKSLAHLRLEQIRYASVRRRGAAAPGGATKLPKVLRVFTGAALNHKLYPVGSQQAADSVHELRETLQSILRSHAACPLVVVNGTLLAHGVCVPTDSYQTVATPFIGILDPVELRSITFGSTVTTAELIALIEALRDPPADIDVKYWQQFPRQQGISGLSLNEQRYKPGMVETVESLAGTPDGEREGALLESLAERVEVLDVVTRRVTDELAYCLGDGSPKIRQAAYQLAERVGDPALVTVVAPHTQSADLDLAQSAIRCLAHLGSEDAARVLVATLMSAKKSDHAVACGQSLGQN